MQSINATTFKNDQFSTVMKKIILLIIACASTMYLSAQHFILSQKGSVSYQTNIVAEDQNIKFNAANAQTFFHLNDHSTLVLLKTESDKLGFIHHMYYQTYDDIRIEKSMFIVHSYKGLLKSTTGTVIIDFDVNMPARKRVSINAQDAVHIALRYVNAEQYAWQDKHMEQMLKAVKENPDASFYPVAQLVWYNTGETLQPRALTLCYKVDVYALQPLSRANYFIDAKNGKVIGSEDRIYHNDATGTANTAYSGVQIIHSDSSELNYRLRDYTKGNGIVTLHGEYGMRGQDYFSNSPDWTLNGFDQAAMDAHFGVEETFAYYFATFGRNSYDGNGTALYSYVNDPTYIDNAFWDGVAMNFNKRSNGAPGGVTGIDVCGHELTHGVTQASCNLVYSYEPGAISESLSDIMGKSVQFFAKPNDIDWRLSNDMNWFIRDLSNPNAYFQPDTYKGTYWYTGSADNGGVHYNSGVGNFMFYLLANGGSGTNDNGEEYSVSSIGQAKAVQIIYRSQTVYLTTNSQYVDWRDACILSASDLFGSSSNEVAQVMNAFYAVGIGNSSTGCSIPIGLNVTNLTKNSATLHWVGPGASGYNLQWKLATALTWKTVSRLSTNTYNLTALLPGVSYNFQVESICPSGSTSGYSEPYTFTTIPVKSYCTSYGSNSTYEFINRVAVGNKGYTSGNNNGYGNFINLIGNLKTNTQYTLQLTAGFTGTSYPEGWAAYIDYNRNGIFDGNEFLGTVTSNGISPANLNFTVPGTAMPGITRLRIQMSYGGVPLNNPCDVFSFGEVEDYSVNIKTAFSINETNNKGQLQEIVISPNPVKNTATAAIAIGKVGTVLLKVCDLSGRIITTQEFSNPAKGINRINLYNLNKLTPGVFIVIAEQNGAIIGRGQIFKK